MVYWHRQQAGTSFSTKEVSNLKSFGNEANILIIINLFSIIIIPSALLGSLQKERAAAAAAVGGNWACLASDHELTCYIGHTNKAKECLPLIEFGIKRS